MKGDKTFIKNFNTTVNFDPETYLGLSQTLKELFCEHSKKNFKKSSIIDFWQGSKYSSAELHFLFLNTASKR